MAKRVTRRSHGELLIHKLWFNLVLALVSLAAAYGFASWAINTGNLLMYAITLFLAAWAINRVILGVRYRLSR